MDDRPHTTPHRSHQILANLPPLRNHDDLSRSLAEANPHTTLLPALPHIPKSAHHHHHHHAKHQSRKASRRPSTASSAEEKHNLLPPVQQMGDLSPSAYSPLSDSSGVGGQAWSPVSKHHHVSVSNPLDEASLQEMNRRAHAAVAGLRAEASRLSGV
ncbi:hypothetical protein OH77DRAFT_1394230, partial [Trametes cingulata]